jgi:hypothetical protein
MLSEVLLPVRSAQLAPNAQPQATLQSPAQMANINKTQATRPVTTAPRGTSVATLLHPLRGVESATLRLIEPMLASSALLGSTAKTLLRIVLWSVLTGTTLRLEVASALCVLKGTVALIDRALPLVQLVTIPSQEAVCVLSAPLATSVNSPQPKAP